MGRLQEKVALITGAGSGLGEGIAKFYSRQGCDVIIGDIASEGGKRVEKEITESRTEDQDIVVNNAGTTFNKKPSVDVTKAKFDRVIAVNTKSIYHSLVEVMPYMAARRSGVYINTSSVAGMHVRPGQVFYGGTKGFVNTVTQGLAAEWGPFNIRVNSICPLRSPTGLLERFSGVPDSVEERDRFAQTVPLRRMGDVDAIGHAAVYLASEEASFVSGVNLPVDGGRLAV